MSIRRQLWNVSLPFSRTAATTRVSADLKWNIAARACWRIEHNLRCRDALPTTRDSECDLQSKTSHGRSLDDCSAKYLTSKSLQPSPVNLGRRRLVKGTREQANAGSAHVRHRRPAAITRSRMARLDTQRRRMSVRKRQGGGVRYPDRLHHALNKCGPCWTPELTEQFLREGSYLRNWSPRTVTTHRDALATLPCDALRLRAGGGPAAGRWGSDSPLL